MQKLATVIEEARELPTPTTLPPPNGAGNRGRLGIRPSRLDNTFEAFDLSLNPTMEDAYERCKAVAEGREWCAFLHGTTGNGKTHLAIAALLERERLADGCKVGIFWKVPDFLDWLRQHLRQGIDAGYGGAKVDEILRTYSSPEFLLVLDDLGTEQGTEWVDQQLNRLLDDRYEERAPTIVTSNVPFDEINERIRSRYGVGYVQCGGKDLRDRPWTR